MRSLPLLALLGVLSPARALADEPSPADVAAGYAEMNDLGFGTMPYGAFFSGAGYPTRWFGVFADVGYHHTGAAENGFTLLTATGGPRLVFNRGHTVSSFAQVMLGAARIKGTRHSEYDFAWGAGVGLDIRVWQRFAVRPAVDYLRIGPDGLDFVRLDLGVVYAL